jgi:hypothetical protein
LAQERLTIAGIECAGERRTLGTGPEKRGGPASGGQGFQALPAFTQIAALSPNQASLISAENKLPHPGARGFQGFPSSVFLPLAASFSYGLPFGLRRLRLLLHIVAGRAAAGAIPAMNPRRHVQADDVVAASVAGAAKAGRSDAVCHVFPFSQVFTRCAIPSRGFLRGPSRRKRRKFSSLSIR